MRARSAEVPNSSVVLDFVHAALRSRIPPGVGFVHFVQNYIPRGSGLQRAANRPEWSALWTGLLQASVAPPIGAVASSPRPGGFSAILLSHVCNGPRQFFHPRPYHLEGSRARSKIPGKLQIRCTRVRESSKPRNPCLPGSECRLV